jgi:SAM-dependent methyltransferase
MNKKIQEIFENHFVSNFWNNLESKSGDGSTIEITTKIRKEIPDLIKRKNINSVLDIPCGDLNWIKTLKFEKYTGCDISNSLVDELKIKYPEKNFLCLDVTSDELPKSDLIIVRDCLVHLSFEQIFKAINNVINSGSEYLLVTTFPEHKINKEQETGKWRSLNLQTDPFLFPEPEEIILENCPSEGFPDKSLGLWRIDRLSKYEKDSN